MSEEMARAIRLAQQGDRQAFYLLYQQHIGRVYAICLRLLGDRQKAEDGAQEVFIRIWQQLPRYRGDSSFSTWVHSIATRTAVDLWRRDRVPRLVDSDHTEELAGTPPAGDTQYLEQAIRQLPPRARAVFVLFALEGYTHQEIASLLGMAEGTSKAQYHRARHLLREYLRDA